MNILDSSAWLECFLDGPDAINFRSTALAPDLLVPSIVIYEVTRVLRRVARSDVVANAFEVMSTAEVVPLDADLAAYASGYALSYKLAMGDAMILATAIVHEAELWTQDADFKDIDGVHYFEKTPA